MLVRQTRIPSVLWLALLAAVGSCSSEDEPAPVVGPANDEMIASPATPVGDTGVEVDALHTYTTGGATSSKGHPVEYRFDLNGGGLPSVTGWTADSSATVGWVVAGDHLIKTQARCAIDTTVTSPWSDGLTVTAVDGPFTELLTVINTYYINHQAFVDTIDFADGLPDTLPYGSWVTLFYRGRNTHADSIACLDPINECMLYQLSYFRTSARFPTNTFTLGWRPIDPGDDNPTGPVDSTSMNIGTVEYDISVRASTTSGKTDTTPVTAAIVGNFDPVLDRFDLRDPFGAAVSDGDTITWTWGAPADSGFIVSPPAAWRRYFFVLDAAGHDHPKEGPAAGIKNWFYGFTRVDNGSSVRFGRSDAWVGGSALNTLNDTVWVEVRYPIGDWTGEDVFVNNPPFWNGRTFDVTVQGRDTDEFDRFQQRVWYDGAATLVNDYATGTMGRWTQKSARRFHLRLVR